MPNRQVPDDALNSVAVVLFVQVKQAPESDEITSNKADGCIIFEHSLQLVVQWIIYFNQSQIGGAVQQ